MYLVYETELIGEVNKNDLYTTDLSLIIYHKDKQIWLLGLINSILKNLEFLAFLIGIFLFCLDLLKNMFQQVIKNNQFLERI